MAKSNLQLHIAGNSRDDAYMSSLRKLSRNKDIHWHGPLIQDDLGTLMDTADIVVVPSLSPENQPQVMLESLARGITVVCADVPGAAELVDVSDTYPRHDPQKLADLLDDKINNPKTIHPVPILTIVQMVQATEKLYQNILRG
jgi:glycosyltransferase involved in cell wall biosynthesis